MGKRGRAGGQRGKDFFCILKQRGKDFFCSLKQRGKDFFLVTKISTAQPRIPINTAHPLSTVWIVGNEKKRKRRLI